MNGPFNVERLIEHSAFSILDFRERDKVPAQSALLSGAIGRRLEVIADS
jgi:hypothetical protein